MYMPIQFQVPLSLIVFHLFTNILVKDDSICDFISLHAH